MSSRITRTVWNPEDPGRTGYWGKATSTIDWCERNYEYSPYIAEMFNTVSNLGFILISVWGLWRIRQQRLPRRLAAAFLGVMIVGVGSAMFHGSLQMQAQAADELPMIYAALLLFYVVFDSTPVGKTPSALPPLALTAFGVVYTYSYYVYPHPVIHEIVYGLILGVTTLRCAWLLNFRPLKTDIERKINNQAWWMESFGAFFFLLAFAIWNVDNWRCVPLTKLKDELGAPTKWLLEGHAWWHIFTMISTFLILSSAGLLSLSIRGHPEHFKLSYDLGIIPWIERTEKGWQALKETERRKKE